MKVLFISHLPPPTTGIGCWTKRLLEKGFPGWEIGFVNSNMIGGRDPFQNTKIRLGDELKRSFSIWRSEHRELNDSAYSIVHTNIPCTVFGMLRETVTAVIAKCHGKKFVLHCHCTVPNVVNAWHKRCCLRLLLAFCDGVIVLNSQSQRFMQRFTQRPVWIIPNFITEEEVADDSAIPIRKTIENVVYMGGVTPDKGCDTIFLAAKELPEITFHLVGSISHAFRQTEIPPNVMLYGNQGSEFVRQKLQEADVFLFLSRYFGEGFSMALTEAMGAGLPCIVTDWAANADMIGTEGGRIIEQKDPYGLIEALHILDDPSIRERAAQRNLHTARQCYTDRVVLPQFSALYERLTNS